MSLTRLLVPLIIGAFFLAFAASLPIALWGEAGYVITPADQVDFLFLIGGFGLALAASAFHVLRALRQYTQALHDLAPEDANDLVTRLVFAFRGIRKRPSAASSGGAGGSRCTARCAQGRWPGQAQCGPAQRRCDQPSG